MTPRRAVVRDLETIPDLEEAARHPETPAFLRPATFDPRGLASKAGFAFVGLASPLAVNHSPQSGRPAAIFLIRRES
jgi:hypothetical protein